MLPQQACHRLANRAQTEERKRRAVPLAAVGGWRQPLADTAPAGPGVLAVRSITRLGSPENLFSTLIEAWEFERYTVRDAAKKHAAASASGTIMH